MNPSNTVNIGANITSKSCHMNKVAVNDSHLLAELCVAYALGVHIVIFVNSDSLDNCKNFRENFSDEVLVPLFKSFAKYCVVCISKCLLCNLKCFIKAYALKTEKSDKLRNRDNRVSIVKLNSSVVGKLAEVVAVLCLVSLDDVLKGSGTEEILLFKTEKLALVSVIVRIENLRNVLSVVLSLNSLVIMGSVESEEVKFFNSLCLPQTKCVDALSTVADNSHVIRNSLNCLILEVNFNSVFLTANTPWVFKSLPVVSNFYLITVLDKLFEKTILVADSVTVKRNLLCSCRIKETSCKSAKTAVTQSGIVNIFKHIDVNAL